MNNISSYYLARTKSHLKKNNFDGAKRNLKKGTESLIGEYRSKLPILHGGDLEGDILTLNSVLDKLNQMNSKADFLLDKKKKYQTQMEDF